MISLERRLQFILAGLMALILIILLIITSVSTRHLLQKFTISSLSYNTTSIVKALDVKTATVNPAQIDDRYHNRFSGHYFSIQVGTKSIINSESLGDESLISADQGFVSVQRNMPGPNQQRIFIWSEKLIKHGERVTISIAEDMSEYKKHLQHFIVMFSLIGLSGIALMLLLQRFIIRQLFKHLDNSRREIKQIESGDRQTLSENVPTEIYPLVKEFNHSLLLMQQRMERSRNSLGNLAHALKTPLSLLMQQLEKGDKKTDAILINAKKQAERIRQLTERELKRARLAGKGNTSQRFDPKEELPVLIKLLKQVHIDKPLQVNLIIDERTKVFGDREDMLELLGNLLDNAFKWAKGEVSCTITPLVHQEKTQILIEDDGKSLAVKTFNEISKRGIRLDESVEGHGLGLAICKDIAALYAGNIRFGKSEKLGGFLVEVIL